jgi:PAS domain S-box-containing protein
MRVLELTREFSSISSVSILDSLSNSVIVFDASGIIVHVNRSFQKKTEIAASDMVGKHILDVPMLSPVWSVDFEGKKGILREVLDAQFPSFNKIRVQNKQGGAITFLSDLIHICDEKTGNEYVVAMLREVGGSSESGTNGLERTQGELQELNHELQERAREIARILKETARYFERFFESNPIGMIRLNLQDDNTIRVLDVNPAANTILGMSGSTTIGNLVEDAFPYLRGTDLVNQFRKVGETGTTLSTKESLYFDGKERRDFEIYVFQIAPQLIIASFIDVTEYKKIQSRLANAERRLRLSFDNAAIGMVWVGTDGKFLRANKTFIDLVGYTEDELLNLSYQDIVSPEDSEISADLVRQMLGGEVSSGATDLSCVHKNGTMIQIRVHAAIISDDSPGKGYFFTQVEDITERTRIVNAIKSSEAALARKSRISDIFLTSSGDSIYDGILQVVLEETKSKYGMFGFIDEDGLLVVPSVTHHSRDKSEGADRRLVRPRNTWVQSGWAEAILDKRTFVSNKPLELPLEGDVHIERYITVPLIHQGRVIALFQVANSEADYGDRQVSIVEDMARTVTPILATRLELDRNEKARQKLVLELQELNSELETRVEEKTRSLREAQDEIVRNEKLTTLGKISGMVGHELRNPLGSIKNAAYFLHIALESATPDILESINIINKEVSNCERIIATLLEYTRPKPPSLQKVSVPEVMQDVLIGVHVPDNISIQIEFDNGTPYVIGDEHQLRRVFINLITNGIQAMPDGGQLRLSSQITGGNMLRISVLDTGVGISSEVAKHLFEPLYTTKAKGFGLGLVVVKSLVEGQSGTINVTSEEGRGSDFVVSLPVWVEEV